MKLALDKYAHLGSPIHRWEQRSKLVALLSLIFAFAFVQELIFLPGMVLVTATLFILSRLPFSFLLSRLRYPGWFIAAVVIFLPFVTGDTVIFQIGELAIKQEGCLQVLLIVTRFICILTVSLVLFGTATFLTSIKALRSLKLPTVIIDMTLLSYRYLEEFGDTLTTMQRAMRLRGFRSEIFSPRNLRILAGLTGSLLVRSYEQSQRVYQAMILRGYGNLPQDRLNHNFAEIDRTSTIAFSLTLLVAVGLIVGEILW
ncbi:MAG: cobalt ECF transporter T component CbiQ [Oscillatoria sp. PMC 1051.18]|nr:cobalt ECF transporter T component CbiQ [Oscillatoria sp. PMC 1050.18]MEC5032438.1 cobalt ECF transporter T component CbiQ [Oscillatoria sp. PMC 1051.18]